MIRTKTLSSYLSATGLGVFAGVAGYLCWSLGVLPTAAAVLPVTLPSNLAALDPSIAAAALIAYSLGLSVAIVRFGLRRSWRFIVVSLALLLSANLVASQFFGTDLLLMPLIFSGGLSLLLIQINRLWSLDRVLFRSLLEAMHQGC